MRLTVGLSVTISWEILFWSLSQMLSVLNTFQIPTGSIKILKTEFTIMMRKGLQMIIMTIDINCHRLYGDSDVGDIVMLVTL